MHNTILRSIESQTFMSQNVTKRYKDNIFTSMYVWHQVEVLIYAVIIIFLTFYCWLLKNTVNREILVMVLFWLFWPLDTKCQN